MLFCKLSRDSPEMYHILAVEIDKPITTWAAFAQLQRQPLAT